MIANAEQTRQLIEKFGLQTDQDLLCWQHGILNASSIIVQSKSPDIDLRLVFVTRDGLDQTFLVMDDISYNTGITWPEEAQWNRDYTAEELYKLITEGEAKDITRICLESQIGHMLGEGGDPYWGPVFNLDKRLREHSDKIITKLEAFIDNLPTNL